ncbi:MAG TPA: hypothetical protein VH189_16360, partial [Rhizomicrobium sp.]|nr:hypothetical protein [Rhizomicrobium sp.]
MIKPIVAAFLILAATPAIPRVESQAWAQNAPAAAPVGPQAETQSLAAPPGAAASTAPGMGDALTANFSIVSMIRRADIVVQVVMGLLLLASLWSWTIIFSKIVLMSGLKRKA